MTLNQHRLTQKVGVWMINEGARKIFFTLWTLVQSLIFGFGFVNYHLKDNLEGARRQFGLTYEIARASAFVLHFNVAFILLPVCRTFVSWLRRGPLDEMIPFEHSVSFHKTVAWSIMFWSLLHTAAHIVNAWKLGLSSSLQLGGRVATLFKTLFTTGPAITGWIMLTCLGVMVVNAVDRRQRANFERFWCTHHLFIVLFICWQVHGMFCFIKPDRPPYCSYKQIGVFWEYWLVGGVIYLGERILREVRARQHTYVNKVVCHPSSVVEVQIKKYGIKTRPGQYIMINCPAISYWQWHPFTLTSAPQDDFVSVHIRRIGDWTQAFAAALGASTKSVTDNEEPGTTTSYPPLNTVMPRVMVDGPFGSVSEDVFDYEVSVLVGAGIGVTPFASVLKAVWHNFQNARMGPDILRKVYLFWICRDYKAFEWFQSLLAAIEADDSIEIHMYMTGRVQLDEAVNIVTHDIGSEVDAVTKLRSPMHYGRPDWPSVFAKLVETHPATQVGVFFCGPEPLGRVLRKHCNEFSAAQDDDTQFVYGKENF
ncbi:hypothetical protein OIO90_002658 [Microbotryomycetes sp. JL221]|nr:hypothetical protein OIO90_002658 [Microbotryomycetes sp. JL221]